LCKFRHNPLGSLKREGSKLSIHSDFTSYRCFD
jgi:hypothetical protein